MYYYRMSSSVLFISPPVSVDGIVEETSSSSAENVHVNSPPCDLFDNTNSSRFNEGLYNNYSQWFRNDTSPYHKQEVNISGVECLSF